MSIHELKEKIKDFAISEKGKDIFVVGIIILASTFSFGLGKLSVSENNERVSIEYDPSMLMASVGSLNGANIAGDSTKVLNTATSKPVGQSQGSYMASKRGKKYYPLNCSAGQSIVEENKIYFSTSADAEKAGYTLSSSCK